MTFSIELTALLRRIRTSGSSLPWVPNCVGGGGALSPERAAAARRHRRVHTRLSARMAASPARLLRYCSSSRSLRRRVAARAIRGRRADAPLAERWLQLDLEPVVGQLDPFSSGTLRGAVREQEPLRARAAEGVVGLVRGEVAPRAALELRRERASPRRRRGRRRGRAPRSASLGAAVARVRERRAVLRRPGSRKRELCSARRGSGVTVEAGRRRTASVRVLGDPERGLEHVGLPRPCAEAARAAARPPGGTQSSGCGELVPPARSCSPDPRHEVAPVVEVEVRDRDRVDARPAVSSSRSRASTPGPQSRSRRPPPASSR